MLASAVERLERGPYHGPWDYASTEGVVRSHLMNPVKCSVCGKEYYIIAGVEINFSSKEVRDVSIRIARSDDIAGGKLGMWPHRGLVMREVLVYSPHEVYMYESLEHLEKADPEALQEVGAASIALDAQASMASSDEEAGGDGAKPIATFKLKAAR